MKSGDASDEVGRRRAEKPVGRSEGDPLTLQKTLRKLRVPIGTVLTIALLVFARPTWASLALSLGFALPGLAIRAWAAGTLRKKQALAVTGPYAYTRNPLYLGSTLLAIGFAISTGRWPFAVLIAVAFFVVYRHTILDEERFLRGRYEGFDDYLRAVPRMLPRLTPARLGDDGGAFSLAQYVKNREYQALIGAIALYAAMIVRLYFER